MRHGWEKDFVSISAFKRHGLRTFLWGICVNGSVEGDLMHLFSPNISRPRFPLLALKTQ